MPSPIILNAPAKINLFLNLLCPRPDGFHEVRFVMQTLALSDQLTVTPLHSDKAITLHCNLPELATTDNLVVKAYHAFYQAYTLPSFSVEVFLDKQIPVQAGLGGGSTDAAAMLKALNQLHGSPLGVSELCEVAASLGSDVPFFLYGGTCLATGRGEKLMPVPSLPALDVVLLKPKTIDISTPRAYQLVRKANAYREVDFSAWETYLKHPHVGFPFQLLQNDFEAALFPHYPLLAKAKQTLIRLGMPYTLMSGSGSTFFTLLDQPESQWRLITDHFPAADWFVARTHFTDSSAQSAPTSKERR